jgi:hypothetical protein
MRMMVSLKCSQLALGRVRFFPGSGAGAGLQAAMETLRRCDRQPARPRPAKPSAISAHVDGSGMMPILTVRLFWAVEPQV